MIANNFLATFASVEKFLLLYCQNVKGFESLAVSSHSLYNIVINFEQTITFNNKMIYLDNISKITIGYYLSFLANDKSSSFK